MANLKQQLIRLGAQKPGLRKDIRPLLAYMTELEEFNAAEFSASMSREYEGIILDALDTMVSGYKRNRETSASNWKQYVKTEEFKSNLSSYPQDVVYEVETSVMHELEKDLKRRYRGGPNGDERYMTFWFALWEYLANNGDGLVYRGFERDFKRHGDN